MSMMGFIDKYFIKKPLLRRVLTKLYYGDKDKTVEFFNTRLYINSIKENGYLRASNYALKSSVFKDEVPALINIASCISADTSFVDIGANVGLYSYSLSKFEKVYKDFKLYAFEANPDTFKRLSKTLEQTRVEIFNYALSDKDAQLEFAQGSVSHVFAEKSHRNSYHLKNSKTVKVNAKRLDQFSIIGNSIILKIDVEGHEYEVLEGARSFFEANRIKAVYLDGFKKKDQIITFLKSYGFKLFDGRTLEPEQVNNFSLLALRQD